MPSNWSDKWDDSNRVRSGKPLKPLTKEQKLKVYGGLTVLSMAFFLTLMVFF